jgi:hypothetical protein
MANTEQPDSSWNSLVLLISPSSNKSLLSYLLPGAMVRGNIEDDKSGEITFQTKRPGCGWLLYTGTPPISRSQEFWHGHSYLYLI